MASVSGGSGYDPGEAPADWLSWMYVVSVAESIHQNETSILDLNRYLESIELNLEKANDPFEDYRVYALCALCSAIREKLK